MKTICLCGSFRFFQEMNRVEKMLARADIACVKPSLYPHKTLRRVGVEKRRRREPQSTSKTSSGRI